MSEMVTLARRLVVKSPQTIVPPAFGGPFQIRMTTDVIVGGGITAPVW